MKKVAFIAAIIISSLVLGCQESNLNSPTDFVNGPSSFGKAIAANPNGVIEVKQQFTLGATEGTANTIDIAGTIQYELVPTGVQDMYQFSVVTNGDAQSTSPASSTGKIHGESTEQLIVNEKGLRFEKSYAIDGLDRPLELRVAFKLSATSVDLDAISIVERSPIYYNLKNAR